MKKYKYNSDLECFERFQDGKPYGKKLWVNIIEARKIVTLYQLGNSVGLIQSKMTFASKKASGHTVKTIIQLYESDEIELDGDYPAPSMDFDNLTVESRMDTLEERVRILEEKMTCECKSNDDEGFMSKVKSWI